MQFLEFQKHIQKSPASPVYAIFGPEAFLKREAQHLIRAAVLGDGDLQMALSSHDGKEVEVKTILDDLRTASFFVPHRLVEVRNCESLLSKSKQAFLDYLASPAKDATLVLVVEKWSRTSKLAKQVAKIGTEVECKRIYDNRLPQWVRARASHYGKTMDPTAARALSESVGGDLGALDQQLRKLALFVGPRPTITPADVDLMGGGDRVRSIFELTEAVSSRQVQKALRVLSDLLLDGAEPTGIITMLARQLKKLWLAKRLLAQGEPAQAVGTKLGVHSYFLEQFLRQTRGFSQDQLRSKYGELLSADLRLKSSRMPPRLVMERLLLKLCA